MDRFRDSLAEAIGAARASVALEALQQPACVAVRLHPFKPGAGFADAEPVPWSPYGYVLAERPVFTLDPLLHAGAYYVQDSSAQFVGTAFRQFLPALQRPLRVLDLCAAPGGKTTDLAASLRAACGNDFLLVANEVMKQRAAVLSDNVSRWGDPCVTVTSADPSAFAALEGFFDMIVADVPCSGEGMFRKDAEALRQWSPDNVALCSARQRRILADVWPALAPGGILVYSTCTFNREENDGNVAWASRSLGADIREIDLPWEGPIRTDCGVSLVPGFVPGEGQYCAVLCKTGGRPYRLRAGKEKAQSHPCLREAVVLRRRGETVVAVPASIADETAALQPLRPLQSGTAIGVYKGRDLVPHPDLALSLFLQPEAFPFRDSDRETALKYLHKDPLVLPDAPRGLLLMGYAGLPLGFVKNLGNRCNNLLPADRRIRMDIV